MIALVTTLIIILAIVFAYLAFYFIKKNQSTDTAASNQLQKLELEGRNFKKVVPVNPNLTLAINRNLTILTVFENELEFEILTKLIFKIEKTGNSILIHYLKQGDKCVLDLGSTTKEVSEFVHNVYKNTCLKKVQQKFRNNNFTLTSASNWAISYFWAYDPNTTDFIYYKTIDKEEIIKITLKKEQFSLDFKYGYFEIPIDNQMIQLFMYEPDFLNELYYSFIQYLKSKTVEVAKNSIYYDNYGSFVYLSNAKTSLQTINIENIKEVEYEQNRICFIEFDTERKIYFAADNDTIEEFCDFTVNYNLSKISKSFNDSTDKLINTTKHTKFIIDFTKNRCLYCANLNKFSQFSYISIAFSNIIDASVQRSAKLPYVRILTLDSDPIDITCLKKEVADYIMAQIKLIVIQQKPLNDY